MQRRTFLKTSTLATAGFLSRPYKLYQADKIKIGIVGTGWWGRDFLTHYALQSNEFEIIGICDVNQKAIDLEVEKINSMGEKKPQVFAEYSKLLDMDGLQAVIISTPTHWHALQFIAACGKGVDIWQEKPISYDIREAQAMEAAHKKAGNVVNIDFPRIWTPLNAEIKDFIHSGQLGEIRQIQFNVHSPNGTAPFAEVPAAIDYNAFCGPAPSLPYSSFPNSIGPAWRGQHGFSRGVLADWGIHYLQNIREIMNLDLPDTISTISATTKAKNEHPNHQEILFHFQGLPVQWSHKGWGYVAPLPHTNLGVFYHGSKGTIFSGDVGWEVYPADRTAIKEYGAPKAHYGSPEYQEGVDLVFNAQFKAFAQAIRQKTNEPIRGSFSDGFMSTAAVNLADIAMRTRLTIDLDQNTLEIKNNPEAQSQFIRKYREGYNHPYLT
ncbi:MAG: Gfo/Idh/MocA family oxidoreductase [Saprospiraceae bacterium]|nr:Gfo/Idh/MocA family oxidoreductase [Saprospiraceae bacterium]